MKVLVLYDYPPSPGGLATQGDLLYRGLKEIGVDALPVNCESAQEKEWYYHWFKPDVVVGVGYWGHTPDLVLHPHRFGINAVPWLVADGYIANYKETLNQLPLILVTSNWVKEVYVRDGIKSNIIEVLPVGCDTDTFIPRPANDPKIQAVREYLGISPDEIMILTVGGDAASKGAREMIMALANLPADLPKWKYVCKVWPQERTSKQNLEDAKLINTLGLSRNVIYTSSKVSRNFMPYLIAACDIYASPSRLEGFGMPPVEANACEKPVIAINAMAFLDTMVHNKTALLAPVAYENRIDYTILGEDAGYEEGHKITFKPPRIANYRASVPELTKYLTALISDPLLRHKLGVAGRKRVVELYDYRKVAKSFMEIVSSKLKVTQRISIPFSLNSV